MNRTLALFLLLTACAKRTPAPDPIDTTPRTASLGQMKSELGPADVTAAIGTTQSVVTVVFSQQAPDATITAWGATGLSLDETTLWTGSAEAGDTHTLTVEHTGDGDLVVRVDGSFTGRSPSTVRSFTVGDRPATPVPKATVGGADVKGWDATAE